MRAAFQVTVGDPEVELVVRDPDLVALLALLGSLPPDRQRYLLAWLVTYIDEVRAT